MINSIALCYNQRMPKRVSLTLSDEAASILADRKQIPFLEQGAWVSEAIVMRATQEETDRQDSVLVRIRQLEEQLAQLKAEVKGQA